MGGPLERKFKRLKVAPSQKMPAPQAHEELKDESTGTGAGLPIWLTFRLRRQKSNGPERQEEAPNKQSAISCPLVLLHVCP